MPCVNTIWVMDLNSNKLRFKVFISFIYLLRAPILSIHDFFISNLTSLRWYFCNTSSPKIIIYWYLSLFLKILYFKWHSYCKSVIAILILITISNMYSSYTGSIIIYIANPSVRNYKIGTMCKHAHG